MKNLLFFLSIILCSISCASSTAEDMEKGNKNSIENYTSKEITFLKKEIENVLKNRIRVDKITKITPYKEASLVEYTYDGNKNGSMGFVSLYDNNGKIITQGGYRIYCTGNCDCGLQGPPEGGSEYLQCKCSTCVMHYESTSKIGIENSENVKTYNIEELAEESFQKTFKKKASKIKIESFSVEKYNDSQIYTITYSSDNNISTYIILKNYSFPDDKKTTNKLLKKDFVVDCTGNCDCREQFYPATGAIQCSCNDCVMTVKEITPPTE